MDYKKLCEPYSENGRTPEGQRIWLIRKGIPPSIVDQAMILVYDEVERGRTFDNGTHFDHQLLLKAQELVQADATAQLAALEEFHQKIRDKWGEDLTKISAALQNNKPGMWQRIKAVFNP